MPTRTRRVAFADHHVLAVLVAHDGDRWLGEALTAVAAQTRPPDRLVVVHTGAEPGPVPAGARRVDLAGAAFPEAVAAGVAAAGAAPAGAVGWLWVLHDDTAPAPEALQELLAQAADMPSAAVLGPKCRSWNGRHLLEIGVSCDLTGRRGGQVEARELDQGQHDQVRDVLAVGSAGALIRHDAWETLGGYDAELPLWEDVDFGWRANRAGYRVVTAPGAVLRHAGASRHGLRPPPGRARWHRVDRESALRTVLANLPLALAVLTGARLLAAGVVRSVVFLLAGHPRYAADELGALRAVLTRPARLRRQRARRRATAQVAHRAVRPLLGGVGIRFSAFAAAWNPAGVAALPVPSPRSAAGGHRRARGSGGGRRPGVPLLVVLAALTLVAARGLLAGALAGGALLPPPAGASDLWHTFLASWHPVGSGSTAAAPPALAVLAVLATVLGGKPWLAVDVLLLGSVPLAGLAAYHASRSLTRHRLLRVWAAATYALAPAVTGAIAGGHLGVAVALAGLPLLLRAGVRVLGRDPAYGGWGAALGAGLLLALLAAFVPLLWPIAAVAGAGGAVGVLAGTPPAARGGAARRAAAVLLALAVPVAVLLPWSARLFTSPGEVLAGAGLGLSEAASPAAHALALADPGGPGTFWAYLLLPVALAALLAPLRAGRLGAALTGWLLVATGLAAAEVVTRTAVHTATGGGVSGWSGLAAGLVGAGLITGAVLAADGAGERLRRYGFGWRHAGAGALALGALAVPLVAGGAWLVRGAGGPLAPASPTVLPTFVAAELTGATAPAALVLRTRADGTVAYTLQWGGSGPTLGSAAVVQRAPGLAPAVAALAAGADGPTPGAVVARLAQHGIGYVDVVGHAPDLTARLDRVDGLSRLDGGGAQVWRVDLPAGAAVVLPRGGALSRARPLPVPAAGDPVGLRTRIPAGPPGRELVLAAARASGWRASVDGHRLLARTADGWAQAFVLPAGGGVLQVTFAHGARSWWLAADLLVLLVAAGAAAATRGGSRWAPAAAVAPPNERAEVLAR